MQSRAASNHAADFRDALNDGDNDNRHGYNYSVDGGNDDDHCDVDVEVVPLTSRLALFRSPSSGLSSTPSVEPHRNNHWNKKSSHADVRRRHVGQKALPLYEVMAGVTIFVAGWWLPRLWVAQRDAQHEAGGGSEPVDATVAAVAKFNEYVPYQVTAAGDVILDFALKYPLVDPPTIPSAFLVWTSVWIPCLVIGAAAAWSHRGRPRLRPQQQPQPQDPSLSLVVAAVAAAVSGLLAAIGVSEGATQVLKLYIARRRPNYFALCGWDDSTRRCAASIQRVREARLSFPSGHSSLAACGAVYATWFLVHRCVLNATPTAAAVPPNESGAVVVVVSHKRALLALVVSVVLPGWAVFVGATRLVDHWHHPSDVVAGLLLGSAVATVTYHAYYSPTAAASSPAQWQKAGGGLDPHP